MRISPVVPLLILSLLVVALPAGAADAPRPDAVVEHMAVKLVRGITNVATAVVELPKQSYLTVEEEGGAGYVIGPVKGLGMMAYRLFIGASEALLFLVPQPGYYDPMIEPAYVWQGWDVRQHAGGK